jgi:hypothetical protein
MSALGLTWSPAFFSQVVDCIGLAEVQGLVFEAPAMNDRFADEQTAAK